MFKGKRAAQRECDIYLKRSVSALLLAMEASMKNERDHIQYLANLEEENERLREALERVKAELCNALFTKRVRHALEFIDGALDDV